MLVKFIDSNAHNDFDYIAFAEPKNVSEYIRVAKESNIITLDGQDYKFSDIVFKPAVKDGHIDVVLIYVEYLEYEI